MSHINAFSDLKKQLARIEESTNAHIKKILTVEKELQVHLQAQTRKQTELFEKLQIENFENLVAKIEKKKNRKQ